MKNVLKVIVMDDDCFASLGIAVLLTKDTRTKVYAQAETPAELLNVVSLAMKQNTIEEKPDAIVLDIEYKPAEPEPGDLVLCLNKMVPDATIVCLSQYGEPALIESVILAGADGFLLKGEIRYALASAIAMAYSGHFVFTPGVESALDQKYWQVLRNGHRLKPWQANPELTPQVALSFWLRVIVGMRASFAAREMGVRTGTVEKYVNNAYQILQSDWADDMYLDSVPLDEISPEDRAFHWFTLPPRGRKGF